MEITELRNETVEWDAFVRSNADGSPFHLIAWKRAVEESFGHKSRYLLARRAGAIEGVLPLFEVRGFPRGRSLVSVPYAVYGGICASTDSARHALLNAASDLAQRRGVSYLELRHRRDQGLGLQPKELYVTFSKEISSNEEENLEAIPRKQRRMVRQGMKHGLRSEVSTDHLDRFYEIYCENLRRLGSPVFPRSLFRAIVAAFDKECQLLTVWDGNRMIAGVLTLFYEDQALPYYGAALYEARELAPNDFMYWELMRYAAAAGYRIFDFGRSRVGTGSHDFKRHWGFEPTPLPYQYVLIRSKSMPNLSPSNPKFQTAVRLWQRMPLALTKLIGPRVVRYLP
ncbi:MAG TPA: FemAB family XrtA/PEP-CTERM system-associated protein [Methylomirabilota bacterium]|nr:FemAB family XrtA/PEP-CTERM system-associated protein [Methylomirabilota bacterium]